MAILLSIALFFFDARTYEQYVVKHHRSMIVYTNQSGQLTTFARAWMGHRHLCGGALSGILINRATGTWFQEYQGCVEQKAVFGKITFKTQPWEK